MQKGTMVGHSKKELARKWQARTEKGTQKGRDKRMKTGRGLVYEKLENNLSLDVIEKGRRPRRSKGREKGQ